MSATEDQLRRLRAKEAIQAELEHSIEERVDRYLQVGHQGIIPNHFFASASTECLLLYRDGYFLSTVMVTQSVAEAVLRFVLERNEVTDTRECPEKASALAERGFISSECSDAFVRIWRSFRNDVHHMNPTVAAVPLQDLAARNIADLAAIEREVFGFRVNAGKVQPLHAKHWDPQPDGTISVFLRLE